MPIVVVFLALAGSIAIFFLYPHLRVLAGAVIALFTALVVYIIVDQGGEEEADAQRIAPNELTLSDITLAEDPRFIRLTGRVTNGSPQYHLREFDLTVTVRDCPAEDAADADCAVIAQDTGIARVDVPAGQTRAFDAVIQFRAQTPSTGVARIEHDITRTHATPPPIR